MDNVIVVLLAGGDSSRFWPITDKNSVLFLGRPLLFHTLTQLSVYGFREIIVVANEKNELLFQKLTKELPKLRISTILQSNPNGQAGAIISVKKQIDGRKILLVNASDIYEDILFSDFSLRLKQNPDGIITGVTQETYFPGGYLSLHNNKIIGIVEKPAPDNIPSNITSMFFYYFKDSGLLLDALKKVNLSTDDAFEKALDNLINSGLNFKFLHYKGYFGYMKYPWHIINIISYFLGKISDKKEKNVTVSDSAILSGKVYLGENVRVLENVKIVGPTYIGSGSIIGNNTLIRESMIGDNCVIGYGCEIARSHIGNNCWFHSNYIGDSVVSNNVSIGAGTVFANFRLDEGTIKSKIGHNRLDTGKIKLGAIIGENTRIGVNVSIMPGVKIGKGCFVGAGIVLDRDLGDDKFCFLKPNFDSVSNRKTVTLEFRKKQQFKLKI